MGELKECLLVMDYSLFGINEIRVVGICQLNLLQNMDDLMITQELIFVVAFLYQMMNTYNFLRATMALFGNKWIVDCISCFDQLIVLSVLTS